MLQFASLVFELFERLFDEDDGQPTQLLIGSSIADLTADPKPYIGKPMLFYYIDKPTALTKTFSVLDSTATETEYDTYNRFGSANERALSANTLSICFGADIDPFFGTAAPRGLYAEYYQESINATYDPRTREFNCEAVFDLPFIINLEMNDTLTFGGNQYTIEEIEISLNTGRAKLKLINKL